MSSKKKREWTRDEEILVAQYLADQPYLGKDQAKETLAQYEQRMLAELNLPNCDVRHLKNKCFSMKKKYEETCKMINQTGMGVTDGNEESFEATVKIKCHYFYILHATFATSQVIHPTYMRCGGVETQPDASQQAANVNPTPRVSPTSIEENELTTLNANEENADGSSNTGTPESSRSNSRLEEAIRHGPSEKRRKTNVVNDLAAAFTAKQEMLINLEKKKMEFEERKWMQQQDLEDRRMNHEIELRRMGLREKEIELEILRAKIELKDN